MMLDIPHNGYATNRKGEKVGPIRRVACSQWTDKNKFYYSLGPDSWYSHGRHLDNGSEASGDLVALWEDEPTGPVRTVTRREVVAGQYGIVDVTGTDRTQIELCIDEGWYTSDQLKAAATVLLELARALSDEE